MRAQPEAIRRRRTPLCGVGEHAADRGRELEPVAREPGADGDRPDRVEHEPARGGRGVGAADLRRCVAVEPREPLGDVAAQPFALRIARAVGALVGVDDVADPVEADLHAFARARHAVDGRAELGRELGRQHVVEGGPRERSGSRREVGGVLLGDHERRQVDQVAEQRLRPGARGDGDVVGVERALGSVGAPSGHPHARAARLRLDAQHPLAALHERTAADRRGLERCERPRGVHDAGLRAEQHIAREPHARPPGGGLVGAEQGDCGASGDERVVRRRHDVGVSVRRESVQPEQFGARLRLERAPQRHRLAEEVEVLVLGVGVVEVARRSVRGAAGVVRLEALEEAHARAARGELPGRGETHRPAADHEVLGALAHSRAISWRGRTAMSVSCTSAGASTTKRTVPATDCGRM